MKSTASPNFGIRFLSFLLSLVLLAAALGAIIIGDIRIATSKENLTTIIRTALFAGQRLPVSTLSGGSGSPAAIRTQPRLAPAEPEGSGTEKSDASQALIEWVYETLEGQYGEEMDLTLETVEAFIEDSTLKDTISELGASLVSDMLTGENTTQLDEQTIRELIEENAEAIEEHFGYKVTTEAVDSLTDVIVSSDYITQIQEEGVESLLTGGSSGAGTGHGTGSSGNSSGSSGLLNPGSKPGDGSGSSGGDSSSSASPAAGLVSVLQSFRAATSATALIGCIAVAAVCAVLLLLLNRRWIWRALKAIGNPMIIAAIPMLIPTALALFAGDLWSTVFSFSPAAGAAVGMLLKLTAPVCVSVFAAGIVLDLAALTVKIVCRSKADEGRAASALSDALTAEEPAAEPAEPPVEP